jgi:hypothetical protein
MRLPEVCRLQSVARSTASTQFHCLVEAQCNTAYRNNNTRSDCARTDETINCRSDQRRERQLLGRLRD